LEYKDRVFEHEIEEVDLGYEERDEFDNDDVGVV
jgi:hypothetical protein